MNKMFLILFIAHAVANVLVAQDLPCAKVASYKIDARLDPALKTVSGGLTLTWMNAGTSATKELWFHLYLNAFKNTHSTFHREMARHRFDMDHYLARFADDGWGYCDIISFSAAAGSFTADLKPQFVQPDDDNRDDETVFKVDLPAAIAPGQSVTVKISFLSRLPQRAPRTGYNGDYFFVAQWFPKIGVWYEDEWNCHQYHSHSEFFADYGDYDVRLTVPAGFIVGASGVRTDSTANNDNTATYRYQQQCIHDFAWTAYADYKVALRTFEHPELPPVTMRLLYQPAHKRYVDDFFSATENTLKHLGLWYVPYPYSHITIVDVAWKSSAGGMEYPTLFTTEVDWLTARGSQAPLGVTVHECAHQFFYGLIASNEFENAWLDEGFTTYATSRCMNTAYGSGAFHKVYLNRDGFGIPVTFRASEKDQRDWIVENHHARGVRDAMDKRAWDYVDRLAYRNNAYEKPALMLWTLENLLGESVWADIMQAYASRWSFNHPRPHHFIDIVNEFAPENMDWFFDKMLNEAGFVDYAVTHIESNPALQSKGYFGVGEGRELKNADAKDEEFDSQVHVERLGQIQLPVELLVTFENGETATELWSGEEPFKIFYFRGAKIDKAEVDPYHKIWLDANPVNNGKYRRANGVVALRWGATWLFWLQDLLEMVAVFS